MWFGSYKLHLVEVPSSILFLLPFLVLEQEKVEEKKSKRSLRLLLLNPWTVHDPTPVGSLVFLHHISICFILEGLIKQIRNDAST